MQFDPENRPGNLNKKVRVYTDFQEQAIVLRVKGKVIGTPNKLRKKIGTLALKTKYIRFDKLLDTETATDTIIVENQGKSDISFTFPDLPEYITMTGEPEVLAPGDRGVVKITFDAGLRGDYGYLIDKIPFKYQVNERTVTGTLNATSTISEDFSHLGETDLRNAPVLELENYEYNMGQVKVRAEKMCTFNYRNGGKSDLIIRSVKIPFDCRLVKYDKILKSGEEGSITIAASSRKAFPNYKKSIDIIVNDPQNPHQILIIRGNIIE